MVDLMSDRGFGEWLVQLMPRLGVTDAGSLRAVLAAHGCLTSERAVSEWIDGASEPSFDKLRAVLGALNLALGDTDVWDAYDRFVRDHGTPDAPALKAEPTSLDDMTRDARLPPGLDL